MTSEEMREIDREVLIASYLWWCSFKPAGMLGKDHIKAFEVNCLGERERALARAVAKREEALVAEDFSFLVQAPIQT